MKRLIYLFLAVCVLGILLYSLADCKKDERFQTTFPLEKEVITATLEKAGLPGIISESETTSYTEGHILYVVRSPTETYDDTSNSVFLAGISSANYEGERMLSTTFDQRVFRIKLSGRTGSSKSCSLRCFTAVSRMKKTFIGRSLKKSFQRVKLHLGGTLNF